MKYAFLVIIIIALLLGSVGCTRVSENKETESSAGFVLTVTSEDGVIDSEMVSPDKSGDNNVLFKFAFDNGLSGIKYLKHGKKITLDFGKNAPDSVSVEDIFLKKGGEMQYNDTATQMVPLTSEGQYFYFILKQSFVSLYSSELPEGRLDIRGFKITARWGGDEKVFAFVILTSPDYDPLANQ